jgi:hypothetical protein
MLNTGNTNAGITLCATFRMPAAGVTSFQAYEEAVLTLLRAHGGTLERRLRSMDGRIEVHIISFATNLQFEAYRTDQRRAEHAALFNESGAEAEVQLVVDVGDE